MIALCLTCYYAFKQDSEKEKVHQKGMSKGQNSMPWQRFKAALNGSIDRAETRDRFRMVSSGGVKWMATYEQQELGLSAYYDNC